MSETKLTLTGEQASALTIWLNVELRCNRLVPKYWHTLNGMFRQLGGHDHENIEHYRKELP